ncbi:MULTISPECIES: DUF6147 family protein [Clostridia]|uniref:DUF6147 family protein n=1 Tax=Clostridia TaxID=186801 RepID=UPI000E50CAEA|nr:MULTISPECIES: DUF6147 family protein [Clostridia]RGH39890.1 hypothetical protein DW901_06410 [Firmicutes bacterium AM41-5BH]RKQ30346.1 hypothetical protein D8Q48_05365 [Ruminococcus sp. B05]TAP33856.1 hypothetical protein EYA86_06710 [Mediterraneibacter sp. gm002]
MKKKIISTLSLILSVCFLFCGTINAEEISLKQVDGSYLTNQDSAESTTENTNARGEHLMDGSCTVSKAGIGKIYVYGQTTAHHTVDKIEVVVYVEKYNAKTDKWDMLEVFTKESKDNYYVSFGKRMNVERGTYYRVRSEHFVFKGDDFEETGCFTDGIMID